MKDLKAKCIRCGRLHKLCELNDCYCINCGIDGLLELIADVGDFEGSSQFSTKIKSGWKGAKRASAEIVLGEELYRKENKSYKKLRYLNRDRNEYLEIYFEYNSKIIKHLCIEPLTAHVQHGDAKKRSKISLNC